MTQVTLTFFVKGCFKEVIITEPIRWFTLQWRCFVKEGEKLSSYFECVFLRGFLGMVLVRSFKGLIYRRSRPEVFCKKGVKKKFHKIHRKTPVPGSLF